MSTPVHTDSFYVFVRYYFGSFTVLFRGEDYDEFFIGDCNDFGYDLLHNKNRKFPKENKTYDELVEFLNSEKVTELGMEIFNKLWGKYEEYQKTGYLPLLSPKYRRK